MNTTRSQRVGIVVSVLWLVLWLAVVPSAALIRKRNADADTRAEAVLAANAARYVNGFADAAVRTGYAATAAAVLAANAANAARYDRHARAAYARAYADAHDTIVPSIFIGVIPLIGWGIWWRRRA